MKNFPEKFADLLKPETKAFAFVATTMADGSPQVTPVWFDADDEHIIINTAAGRVKDRNLQARPKVSIAIPDPADPYRYIQIRGEVVERTTEGANEQMDTLSIKYTGKPWELPAGQQRVIFKIKPLKFDEH
jgi:PPOX class probable F420-dependent enzyme